MVPLYDDSNNLIYTIDDADTTWYTVMQSAAEPSTTYYVTAYNAASESIRLRPTSSTRWTIQV